MRTQSKIFFSPLPSALLHLTCIFCLLSAAAFSQPITFEKYYDLGYSEDSRCVQQTTDGGYIMAGFQGIWVGVSQAFLIKTDSLGQTVWSKTYGGPDNNEFWSVRQTYDGGYIATGQTTGSQSNFYDTYLVKTDSNGDTLWTKHYKAPPLNYYGYGRDIIQTQDSGYALLANVNDTDTIGAILLIKTKSNGDTIWTKKYRNTFGTGGTSLKPTSDGGYIISGFFWNTSSDADVYLIKTNSNGDTLWTKKYGTPITNEGANSVCQTNDGGYFLGGSIYYISNNSGDAYLIKTNSIGDTTWTKKYGGTINEVVSSVTQTNDGKYISTGYTTSFGAGGADLYLLRLDATGDTLWTETFGTVNDENGKWVIQTSDGGFAATGYSGYDAYLVKTDSNGIVMTGINEITENKIRLKIYPNPFFSYANIEIEKEGNTPYLLTINDAIGKEVGRINVENSSFVLQRNGLPSGMYFLNVYNSSLQTIAGNKIIIQ